MHWRFSSERRQHCQCHPMAKFHDHWPDPPPGKARDVQRRAAALVLNSKLRDELGLLWIIQIWGCRLCFKASSQKERITQGSYMKLYMQLHRTFFSGIPSGPGLGCPALQHLWQLSETIRASCPGQSVTGNWCDWLELKQQIGVLDHILNNFAQNSIHSWYVVFVPNAHTHTDNHIESYIVMYLQ